MVNWHARVDGNNDVRFMDVSDVLLFIIIFLRLSLLFWSRLRCFSTILVRLSYEWVVNNVMHRSDMMFSNHVMDRSNVMNRLNNVMHGNNFMNWCNMNRVDIVMNISDMNNFCLLVLLLFIISLMRLFVLGIISASTTIIVVHLEDKISIINIRLAAHEER